MSEISAKFKQSPSERKRYVSDFTLDLDDGETITGVVTSVTSTTDAPVSPALVCNSVMVAPSGTQFIYYISGGVDANTYMVDFEVTTSLSKTLESVVQYDIAVKVPT